MNLCKITNSKSGVHVQKWEARKKSGIGRQNGPISDRVDM